ncbi:unnamed protein product [Effrenium voratum]|uniref:Uncharacterized protein n=1 Tax=Effrenium voratum TaxID=2562239 RepID=A0AA36NFS5_9DINO|nr:unnamed protein product [Effrenium voratum]
MTGALREGPLQPEPAPRSAPRRSSLPTLGAQARQVPGPGLEPGSTERCRQLELEVLRLKQENAALQARLEAPAARPAPASEPATVPGADFIQAMPASTPTRKSLKAAGYAEETEPVGEKKELWSKARCAVQATAAISAPPEDRRQLRRDLKVERAQRRRLERELAALRGELAKCESIVEQLMEEIEDQCRHAPSDGCP